MTSKKMIWESNDSDKVYRQTTVVTAGGDFIGKPYYFKELMKGDVGITLQVDLGKALPEGLSERQRMTLHSLLLKMAFNVLTHKRLMIGPAVASPSAASEPKPEPAIVESGEEMPSTGVVDLLEQITDGTREAVQNLFQCGHIMQEEIDLAMSYAYDNHVSVLVALEHLKFVSEDQVAQARAEQHHLPFVNLEDMEIDPEVIASVPKNVVVEQRIIPVQLKQGTIVVAFAEMIDFFSIDNLHFILNAHVEPVFVTKSALGAAIEKYYGEPAVSSIDGMTDAVENELFDSVDQGSKNLPAFDELEELPTIKLVNLILLQGIKAKVTKIIIAAEEDACPVQMKIEGRLYKMQSPPALFGPSIVTRLKVMADVKAESGSEVGRIELHIGGRPVDIDASFVRLARGELAILDISYPDPKKKKNDGDDNDPEGPAPIGAKP